MRVLVTGATGNLGSAVVRELSAAGHDVVGVARRSPVDHDEPAASVTWREADVGTDDLDPVVAGADAVVHLAWRFQPTRRPEVTWATNAVGTRRLLDAVVTAGVPALVCITSIAAYSPMRHDDPVDESWPTDGTSAAAYCREKAYVERSLDALEQARPDLRVVRLRPAFVFQRSSASEQRRIFGGPLARPAFFDTKRVPLLPVPRELRFQAVHSGDVAAAVLAAVEQPVRGAVNLAGPGLLRRQDLARLLEARTVEVPSTVVRSALASGFRSRLIPVPPELYDAFMRMPVLDTGRAERELGWAPRHTAEDAVSAFLSGAAMRAGSDLPPLHR
jgi:nucleoside-diphosphate-sugar epimerase